MRINGLVDGTLSDEAPIIRKNIKKLYKRITRDL